MKSFLVIAYVAIAKYDLTSYLLSVLLSGVICKEESLINLNRKALSLFLSAFLFKLTMLQTT